MERQWSGRHTLFLHAVMVAGLLFGLTAVAWTHSADSSSGADAAKIGVGAAESAGKGQSIVSGREESST